MPPNHEQFPQRKDSVQSPIELNLTLLPQSPSPVSSEHTDSTPEDLSLTEEFNLLDFNDGTSVVKYERIIIPIEQNLKDLVREATGLTNISEVTKLKLKVISREVGLQRLSIYTPKLTELILDGSYVSTLRDLGCSLINLKILRVVRCNLKSLDGMFGLETLEEIYAGSNNIDDISSCSSLPIIKKIDVRNNQIKDITSVSFLCLCETLRHLVLEGNLVADDENYRDLVKGYIPFLTSLDDIYYPTDLNIDDDPLTMQPNVYSTITPLSFPTRNAEKKGKIILPKIPSLMSSKKSLNSPRPYTSESTPIGLPKIAPIRPSTSNDSMLLRNRSTSAKGASTLKCTPRSRLTAESAIDKINNNSPRTVPVVSSPRNAI